MQWKKAGCISLLGRLGGTQRETGEEAGHGHGHGDWNAKDFRSDFL